MALIAVLTERSGAARIFFDLREPENWLEDRLQIAKAIEHAFGFGANDAEAVPVPRAA
jgi:hypothetical protein